jgi:hypothetical protein
MNHELLQNFASMVTRLNAAYLIGAVVVLLVGCSRNEAESISARPPTSAVANEPFLRFHWAGIDRLRTNENAASTTKILELPESSKLKNQTLDRLGAQLSLHAGLRSNVLKPFLEDVLKHEVYLEAVQIPDASAVLMLSVKLDAARSHWWETNLATAFKGRSGSSALTNATGWTVACKTPDCQIRFSHKQTWTVVEMSRADGFPLETLVERHELRRDTFLAKGLDGWGRGAFSANDLATFFKSDLKGATYLPQVSFVINGDGTNLVVQGNLQFTNAILGSLKPWQVPTNLIHSPLTSFTAFRGFNPALNHVLKNLHFESLNQFYVWAEHAYPMQTYFAAPVTNAPNAVAALTEHVLAQTKDYSISNDLFGFERSTDSDGLKWKGVPYVSPYFRSESFQAHSYFAGGFLRSQGVKTVNVTDVPWASLAKTNLVYFDSEQTGARIDDWLFMGQFWRVVTRSAQLPADSAAIMWLKAIAPKAGVSTTTITAVSPRNLEFERRSSVGLTGVELQILADWLESPQFPMGFYSLVSTNTPLFQ